MASETVARDEVRIQESGVRSQNSESPAFHATQSGVDAAALPPHSKVLDRKGRRTGFGDLPAGREKAGEVANGCC